MNVQDLAGLIGILILALGILAMGLSGFVLLFPRKSQDFVSPADEQDATNAVNGRPR